MKRNLEIRISISGISESTSWSKSKSPTRIFTRFEAERATKRSNPRRRDSTRVGRLEIRESKLFPLQGSKFSNEPRRTAKDIGKEEEEIDD